MKITTEQLKSLQSTYAAYCRREIGAAGDRSSRLAWAEFNLQMVPGSLSSFKDLTTSEASKLIDILKTALGQEVIAPDRSKRKQKTRDEAQRAGTAGRRSSKAGGSSNKDVALVSSEDLARIQAITGELGWNQARLDAFLHSGQSPLGRGRSQIRTQADANKVYWALKRMRDRQQKAVAGI